ncbi:hypothetical protein ACFC6J_06675 [Enterococcus casseliflavus]|uniref:hypothetical protein n=1 Tax=Enterococcus casseliflavus TaxID=37734 RepID=UPI0035E035A4
MAEKVDYVICSIPDHVNVTCPYCDWEDDYNWDDLHSKMGNELYFGDCGSIECADCGQEIQLGKCEYD